MIHFRGLILALLAGCILLPGTAEAQKPKGKRPSNNMWTRSAGIYLDKAHDTQVPQDRESAAREALKVSLEGLAKDDSNPKLWYYAGRAYLLLDDYVGADSTFDRAEALWSPYEEVQRERFNAWVKAHNAGVALIQQQKVEEAVAEMERADLIYQGRPDTRLNLGTLYARQNDLDRAVAAYRGALEIMRSPAGADLKPEELAQWREYENIAATRLGQILLMQEKLAEGAQVYRELLARQPENLTAKTNLALVLHRTGAVAEANEIYTQLLAIDTLTEADYFNIGLGLYRGEQYEQAEAAFEKALAVNPYYYDALYNRAQSILARTIKLEQKHQEATGEAAKQAAAELAAIYTELKDAAERLQSLNPLGKTVLLLTARAYRGLGDVTADPKAAEQWKQQLVKVLERERSAPFHVADIGMVRENETVQVKGKIENVTVEPGQPIRFAVSVLSRSGAVLATEDVAVPAPAAGAAADFEVSFTPSEPAAGFKYEPLQ